MPKKRKISPLLVIVILCIVGLLLYTNRSYIFGPTTGGMPPRQVGETLHVEGTVTDVIHEAYCVKVSLKLSSDVGSFKKDQVIQIQFTGIGDVTTWKSYKLQVGQVIGVQITWVEASYWEAVDSSIVYPTGGY